MTSSAYGLLRSARLVLIPTIFTNALVAWVCVSRKPPVGGAWLEYLLIVATGVCFYFYGMWENDRLDARWDRKYRIDKPVPKGEVSIGVLRIASLIAGGCALLLCWILLKSEMCLGVVLMLVIILYNWMHKVRSEAVVLMGACRGGWVILAGIMAFHVIRFGGGETRMVMNVSKFYFFWLYALSLCIYTLTASLVARGEFKSEVKKKWAGILLSSMCLHDFIWLVILVPASHEIWMFALACYGITWVFKLVGQADS